MNYHRFAPFFIATALPLLTFSWFVPKGVVQLDLWLLWLLAMVVVGLPMMFLELALARRSKQTPWQGIQVLTRESDSHFYWRIFALLSVLLSVLLATGFTARLAERLTATSAVLPMLEQMPSYAVAFVLTVIALILSPLKQRLLAMGLALVLLSALVTLAMGQWSGIDMTQTNLKEWAMAVTMALFSVGLGTGLYWFLNVASQATPTDGTTALSRQALPIWVAQFGFGVLGFAVTAISPQPIGQLIGAFGVVLIVAFLLHYAFNQLMGRFGMIKGVVLTIILTLILCALPSVILANVLMVVGLLSALVLSLFAGWQMKISHLRKSLNFKSELRYNLWRIAVRWLVPLAIVSALVGGLMP